MQIGRFARNPIEKVDVLTVSSEATARYQMALNKAQDFSQLTKLSIDFRQKRIQLMKELAEVEGFIEEVDDRLDAITAQSVAGR